MLNHVSYAYLALPCWHPGFLDRFIPLMRTLRPDR